MPIDRDAAWAMLHDPATEASALAEIAAAYPEFAEAVARHPHAYPELVAWAGQVSVPAPEPAAQKGPGGRRLPRWAVIGGIAAAGVLVLAATAWAAAALLPTLWGADDPVAAASDAAGSGGTPAPSRTLAGDPVYIGDDLDWFLPTEEQRGALSPGGSQTETDASYYTDGESAGAAADKTACLRWILTDDDGFVGVRRATWQPNGTSDRAFWLAFQFATGDQADAYYRSFTDTLAGCGTFQMLYDGKAYRTISLDLVAGATDEGSSFVVREVDDDGTTIRALAREGNVVVLATVPYDDAVTTDPSAYADVLTELTTQARARLTEEIGYR